MLEQLLPAGLPEDPAERAEALKAAIENEAKIESIIATALLGVTEVTTIPITRLASNAERCVKSARARAMADALVAAQATASGEVQKKEDDDDKDKDSKDNDDGKADSGMGILAAMRIAAYQSGKPIKGRGKGNTAAAKDSNTDDILKLGRHMLK